MNQTASIQEVESFWNARPCNLFHGTAEPGTREWSEQVTARKYFVEPHIPKFTDFEMWRWKNVLEIGCGLGTDTLEFVKHGSLVDAIDLSQKSIELARQRFNLFADPSAPGYACFYRCDAEEFLPKHLYDLIYSFGVLHHTPCPERILCKAHDRLKPNGQLRIMLYAKWSLKNLLKGQREAQASCPIARVYSVSEAKKLLSKCGFHVVSVEKTHIFPYRVKDYIQHKYVKRWYYRWMPKRLFSWLESKLGWHLLITAELKG